MRPSFYSKKINLDLIFAFISLNRLNFAIISELEDLILFIYIWNLDKKYGIFGIGAALVDKETVVTDNFLAEHDAGRRREARLGSLKK